MGRTARDLILLGLLSVVFGREGTGTRVRRTTYRTQVEGAREYVVLVVSDGLRWQEVFGGADHALMFGNPKLLGGNPGRVRAAYWRSTPAERRAALMPFLWGTVAREGQLAGNRALGSAVTVTNDMWFSYPGYNEMLVGRPDDARIDNNNVGPNPNVTVFEWLNGRSEFRGRVHAVGMWSTFREIFNVRRSGIPVDVGETDAGTYEMAKRRLAERPAALFIGFGATDDLAHKGRYDLTLDAAHAVDAYLADLWKTLQASQQYRGRTTLIVTADHGRGRGADWTDHGRKVPGANETWFAVIGPHARALGELRGGSFALSQIAATIAAAVGANYHAAVTGVASPIRSAIAR